MLLPLRAKILPAYPRIIHLWIRSRSLFTNLVTLSLLSISLLQEFLLLQLWFILKLRYVWTKNNVYVDVDDLLFHWHECLPWTWLKWSEMLTAVVLASVTSCVSSKRVATLASLWVKLSQFGNRVLMHLATASIPHDTAACIHASIFSPLQNSITLLLPRSPSHYLPTYLPVHVG